MKPEKLITKFISEARKRGFSDLQIRKALLDKNYPINLIDNSFIKLQPKFKLKNQICVFLNDEIISCLESRAKKNSFTLSEQIEDVLRRSTVNKKKSSTLEKLDDTLVSIFSRKK